MNFESRKKDLKVFLSSFILRSVYNKQALASCVGDRNMKQDIHRYFRGFKCIFQFLTVEVKAVTVYLTSLIRAWTPRIGLSGVKSTS